MVDFYDNAYAPFWDSIEKVAKLLAQYCEEVERIKNNALYYRQLRDKCNRPVPGYPISSYSLRKLYTAADTADKMTQIARKA